MDVQGRSDKVTYRLSPLLLHRVFVFTAFLNVLYVIFKVCFVGQVAEEIDEDGRAVVLHMSFHLIHMSHLIFWLFMSILGYTCLPISLERHDKLKEFHYVCTSFTLRICYEWIQDVSVGKLQLVNLQTGIYPISFWFNFVDGPAQFLADVQQLFSEGKDDEDEDQGDAVSFKPSVSFHNEEKEVFVYEIRSQNTSNTNLRSTSTSSQLE